MKIFSLTALVFLGVAVSSCAGGKTSNSGEPVAVSTTGPASGKEIIKAFDGGILPETSFKKLSRKDRTRALLAEYRALESSTTGQSTSWQSPNGKTSGTVTPAQPYKVGSQNCRQYTHIAIIRGETAQASGAACRSSDGRWVPLR